MLLHSSLTITIITILRLLKVSISCFTRPMSTCLPLTTDIICSISVLSQLHTHLFNSALPQLLVSLKASTHTILLLFSHHTFADFIYYIALPSDLRHVWALLSRHSGLLARARFAALGSSAEPAPAPPPPPTPPAGQPVPRSLNLRIGPKRLLSLR